MDALLPDYSVLYRIHVTTVVISLALFVLRGIWMMMAPSRLRAAWVRIVPHVNDTLLLLSAIGLSLVLAQYPLAQGWLTAKLVGLVVYIALGTVALKGGRSPLVRITAWVLALAVFGYIVLVAWTRHPLPLAVF